MQPTTKLKLILSLTGLSLALAGCEPAEQPADDLSDNAAGNTATGAADNATVNLSVTALVGATLIDGTGAAPVADAVVVIDGTEIAAAGARGSVRIPQGAAVVAESAVHGFKVTTHVTELEPARVLVELGVDSLQHLPLDAPLDAAFLELAKSSGIVVVPTLAVWRRNFVDLYDQGYELLEVERRCGDPQVIASWYEVDELPAPPIPAAE